MSLAAFVDNFDCIDEGVVSHRNEIEPEFALRIRLEPAECLLDCMQHSGFGLWVRDNHCVGWGLGDTPLPVVLADDVADALVRLAAYEGHDLDGQALNLCTQAPLTAREIVEELRRATGRDLHFHPRPLWLSQGMEIGKWMVKVAGRRPGAAFPSYRDLKSRSLAPRFSSRTAREVLGWQPVEDRETLLERAVRIYSPRAPREVG